MYQNFESSWFLIKKIFAVIAVTVLACSAVPAGDVKIGRQIYTVYPINIRDGSVIDNQVMPNSTKKLIESNIAVDGTVIIRDRRVLGYFFGTRFIQGLLTDYILFTCRTGPCNPTDKTVFSLNEHTYSYGIKAESLTEWYDLIDLLRKSTAVKAVFPNFINDARGKFTISDVQINGVMEKKFYYDQNHK